MPDRNQTLRRARAILGWLGRMSPDEIASYLERKGIKGHPTRAVSCPLARYLRQRLGVDVTVGATYARVWDPATPCGVWGDVELPDNVYEFRRRFDVGEFPALEEDEVA